MPVTVLSFGEFKLDCDRFELRRKGSSLRLERKPMELLILLAARKGHLVTRSEIAERLWDRDVFVDTEHGINTAVRKLRQALRDDPERPRFVQTVTGKGYRFIGSVEELSPPVTRDEVAAAAAGSAPQIPLAVSSTVPLFPAAPVALDSGAALSGATSPLTSRRSLWSAAAVSAALLCLIAVLALRAHRTSSPASAVPTSITSVAVLPLDNVSGEPGQDYLADGMTDELITMLAKNSTLRVVSRTSVMQYRGVHRPLPQVARELGVDGILEGSIARSGSRVHLTAQLIQAAGDTHLWAESYDRDSNDLVSLPREAAETIAWQLHRSVPQPVAARFVRPEAHDAYLRGRYLWFADNNEKAGEYFRKATELQPDYALGWSGLSIYYGAGAIEGNMDPTTSLVPAETAAARAVALDPSLPEAHLAMSAAIFLHRWDWNRASQEIARATELDPRFAEAFHFHAKMLAALNRHDEAIAEQRKATELDPFSRPWALALSLLLARQYDRAIEEARQRLEGNPQEITSVMLLSMAYRERGDDATAVATLAKGLKLAGDEVGAAELRSAFARGGARAAVEWQLSGLRKDSATRYVSPVRFALCYAQLGRRERTLALLEEGLRQRSPLLLWIQSDPAYDFLHTDLRYRALIQQIGLPVAF